MAIFDILVDDAQEYQLVPPGEYQLRVVKADAKKSKAGDDMIVAQLEIMNPPASVTMAGSIFEYFLLPDGRDAKSDNMRKLNLKQFLTALGLSTTRPIDTDEWVGQRTWALVSESPANDKGPAANRVSKWVGAK